MDSNFTLEPYSSRVGFRMGSTNDPKLVITASLLDVQQKDGMENSREVTNVVVMRKTLSEIYLQIFT